MTKQNHLLYDPAADLDLPRKPKSLPKGLLSIAAYQPACSATLRAASQHRVKSSSVS
jgi:hypothetical protein